MAAASLRWALAAAALAAARADFAVSEQLYEAFDAARGGHRVVATLYVAIGQSAPAPAVAFGHGFGLGPGDYPVAKELTARRGMVVFLPHDLGVPSTKNLALDQVFLLAHAVEQSRNYSSVLYGRVANKTVLAGHSLGGGSSILAADAALAAAYPPPTALATLSLGTYTIPGALPSAPRVPAALPALLLTATEDCIDPPAKNSLPIFEQLKTGCAVVASVAGGSHCQYASPSLGCSTTEKICGARPSISREEQVGRALEVLLPFLDAALGGAGAWSTFDAALGTATTAGRIQVLAERTAGCGAAAPPPPPVAPADDDAQFAVSCQRYLAGDVARLGLALDVEDRLLPWAAFLTTKPTLLQDPDHHHANVTMITHSELTAPFSHSLAIKMRSAEAISGGALSDNATCAGLHALALEAALARLAPAERQAYGVRTKTLRFAADEEWHTGLWVPMAKLKVEDHGREVVVTSPRFHAPAKGLPERWGGMTYCRLLPPSALAAWIQEQVPPELLV